MTVTRYIAALAITCAAGATQAVAADVVTVPTSTPIAVPVHDEGAFSWDGFYAGVYGVTDSSSAGQDQYGLGIQAGVNTQFEFLLAGAEVSVQGLSGDVGTTTYGQILGRAGLVVSDDVLVYGAGGYGLDLGAPEDDDLLLGGGLEVAVTDSVSLNAQYLRGVPLSGGDPTNQVTLGAKFHF